MTKPIDRMAANCRNDRCPFCVVTSTNSYYCGAVFSYFLSVLGCDDEYCTMVDYSHCLRPGNVLTYLSFLRYMESRMQGHP